MMTKMELWDIPTSNPGNLRTWRRGKAPLDSLKMSSSEEEYVYSSGSGGDDDDNDDNDNNSNEGK
jgi:hypothetical protein